MIDIHDITYSYGRKCRPVLDSFSLKLTEGGVYGLLGPNGAGKSTLLGNIAGTLLPQKGRVLIDGQDASKRRPDTLAEVFYVPEEFSLPAVRLDEYLRLQGRFYPRFSSEDMTRHMQTFGLDSDVRLDALSMGQKKKVYMCFAMACNTKVLLMDEPTNGLDIPGKSIFRRFVAGAMDDDRIFLISTHQVRDVEQLLDRIIIMDSHRVILRSTMMDVQRRLKFIDGVISPDGALFAQPGIGGSSVVVPNSDGDDTEVNLELLFNFAISDPEGARGALGINSSEISARPR